MCEVTVTLTTTQLARLSALLQAELEKAADAGEDAEVENVLELAAALGISL